MPQTPEEFCDILGRQRTSHGLQTYFYTYNKSFTNRNKRLINRLQQIRQLSEYVWVPVAKSFTPTYIAGLGLVRDHPISKDEAEGARATLQPLDSQQVEKIKEGVYIRNRVPQRTISKDNLFPVAKDNTSTPFDINSWQQDPITININPGDSESAKGIQDFLSSLEQECSAVAGGPICILSENQLHRNLESLFSKPLFWQSFTSRYPLPDNMPTTIPDFLAFLKYINVQIFSSPPITRSALNFLDMTNVFLSCVPVPVRQADLLRTAYLRKRGSASNHNSVSPIHVDTAGHLTWIIGICGRKVWYVPNELTLAANRLATGGSQFPEHYEGGWMRIIIEPGDLLIMPPGCPHAVFTPEDSFTVGGDFFTSSHLGTTITATALQARYGYTFCNEKLSLQDYLNLALVLEQYQGSFSDEPLARLVASKVGWEAAKPLDTDEEATHREVAEDPASSPGGECRAEGGKGGNRKRGKSVRDRPRTTMPTPTQN
ncbi:uncharacterized protein BJX67DRAFT_375922 [Aspergillus lucknowensis]|uniref:JmjC domain-containing protein n=1 Tax=Aspergillus lucknowensis TaxID=176173 RepID=A0ABR4L904_9EURO